MAEFTDVDTKTFTKKGKQGVFYQKNFYSKDYVLKLGDISWICMKKSCTGWIRTDENVREREKEREMVEALKAFNLVIVSSFAIEGSKPMQMTTIAIDNLRH